MDWWWVYSVESLRIKDAFVGRRVGYNNSTQQQRSPDLKCFRTYVPPPAKEKSTSEYRIN
jgi:hypothetical protein